MDDSNTRSGFYIINFTPINIENMSLINERYKIDPDRLSNLEKSEWNNEVKWFISNNVFTVALILFLISSLHLLIILIHFDNTVNFSCEPEASKESNGS